MQTPAQIPEKIIQARQDIARERTDKERADFEAWLNDPHYHYTERDKEIMFDAWKARAALFFDAWKARADPSRKSVGDAARDRLIELINK